jgi:hypothetical protein
MKLYRYWAKAAAEKHPEGMPVECFGCSNESVEAALADAKVRANKFAEALQRDGPPDPYLYEDRPVREEIIREFEHNGKPTAVLTRNAYGSVVLNTPHVLFADIDYKDEGISLGGLIGKLFGKKEPSQDEQIVARIEEIVADDRSLGVRVYRTKNGFRCLVKSKTYDPLSPESDQLLQQFGSDPRYVRLCKAQACYRARVSPKPWRCGVGDPPAKFPFRDEEVERRYREWQRGYEERAKSFSTCAKIGDFGSTDLHPAVDSVMQLHDHLACEGDGPLC